MLPSLLNSTTQPLVSAKARLRGLSNQKSFISQHLFSWGRASGRRRPKKVKHVVSLFWQLAYTKDFFILLLLLSLSLAL